MTWITTLCIGLLVLGVAAVLAVREHLWLRQAGIGQGVVIELIPSRSSKGSTTYAPKVRFQTAHGLSQEFTRGYFSSPPEFKVGETVQVAYDPQSYEGRILTFGQRFGIAVIVGTVGLAIVCLASTFLIGRSLMPKLYPVTGSVGQSQAFRE
jgi:hypothetical protein